MPPLSFSTVVGGKARIVTGDAFVGRHTPPDWLIEGIIQKSRLYACTSITGHGKTAVWLSAACMVQSGRMFGTLDVAQGTVLYLAGENPQDLQARMLGMCRHYKIPSMELPYVLPQAFPLDDDELDQLARDIDDLNEEVALIVGDTAASYFPGEEENSNVQIGAYARRLRRLTQCNGSPAVVMLSHPTKGAEDGQLLPRGGGAFLNELDGNLALWSAELGEVTQLRGGGKLRGPPFNPVDFKLVPVETGLADSRGNPEVTIIAVPISEAEADARVKALTVQEDAVLEAMRDHPDWSMSFTAASLGWVDGGGNPEKYRVQRCIRVLAQAKLVRQPRPGKPWIITQSGEDYLDAQMRGP